MSREQRIISALAPLPQRLQKAVLSQEKETLLKVSEIRLRKGKGLVLTGRGEEYPVRLFGQSVTVSGEDIEEAFRNICECSAYSHEEEIKNGYVTFKGGHRAGLAGVAYSYQGEIQTVRDISSICIRIAGAENGAAEKIFNDVFLKTDGSILIAGPPASGKTTILRDIIRKTGSSVSVIDERNEIAALKSGESDIISANVDIFSGYPKPVGIEIATRCFSPRIIVCDEIAPKDTDALLNALFSGVRIIASVHAGSKEELFSRPFLKKIFRLNAFKTAVLLKGGKAVGEIEEIIDLRSGE